MIEDYKGINLEGEKEYEGERPNAGVLQERVNKEIRDAYLNLMKKNFWVDVRREVVIAMQLIDDYNRHPDEAHARLVVESVLTDIFRVVEKRLAESYKKSGNFDETEFNQLFSREKIAEAIAWGGLGDYADSVLEGSEREFFTKVSPVLSDIIRKYPGILKEE